MWLETTTKQIFVTMCVQFPIVPAPSCPERGTLRQTALHCQPRRRAPDSRCDMCEVHMGYRHHMGIGSRRWLPLFRCQTRATRSATVRWSASDDYVALMAHVDACCRFLATRQSREDLVPIGRAARSNKREHKELRLWGTYMLKFGIFLL